MDKSVLRSYKSNSVSRLGAYALYTYNIIVGVMIVGAAPWVITCLRGYTK
jgi:hypothetical protein